MFEFPTLGRGTNNLKMGCGSAVCGVSGTLYTLILCLTGWSCLYSCFYRSKMRGQYFLEESPCADCCVHCWCEGCALCQEYRELQNRGFDLSIGLYFSLFSLPTYILILFFSPYWKLKLTQNSFLFTCEWNRMAWKHGKTEARRSRFQSSRASRHD